MNGSMQPPANRRRRGGEEARGGRPTVLAGIMLLASVLLVTLAVPRLIGGLPLVWAAQDLRTVMKGESLDQKGLGKLAGRLEKASAWVEDGQVRTDLGFVLREIAWKFEFQSAAGQAVLAEAARQIRIGLGQSPVDPYAWLRLARILDLTGAPAADILGALRMSVLTGTYVPKLFEGRLELALRYWDDHDQEMRDLVERQIRVGWSRIPNGTVKRSMAYERTFEVAEALDSLPGAREEFRARLLDKMGIKPYDP